MTRVERLDVSSFVFPLDKPESDGTLTWDSTTMVLVEVSADGVSGIGYTYGSAACATVIEEKLRDIVVGSDPLEVTSTWEAMVRTIRNIGRPGVVSNAISAVDTALWDLKARLLETPLFVLLGAARDEVPVYGSGGFTSLSNDELEHQLAVWVGDLGIPRVKIKIAQDWGSNEGRDLERVAFARRAVGDGVELYVDANGGYTRKQAVRVARCLSEHGVTWFEEPVSSDDLDGLREIRDLIDIDVAAGEYGYSLVYFQRLLAAGAVDCLQADVTRCGGITEFLRVASVAGAYGLDISAHTAPSISLAPCAAVPNFRHLEYFADHERIERAVFSGAQLPQGGALRADSSAPGTGLGVKRGDVERFRRL